MIIMVALLMPVLRHQRFAQFRQKGHDPADLRTCGLLLLY